MKQIVSAVEDSIVKGDMNDLTIDLAEIGIDSALSDGFLKEIPIVKIFYAGGKLVMGIREYNLLEQTLEFMQELNKESVDSEKIEKHKKYLEKNKKNFSRELERVLIILDRNTEAIKSRYIAKFYRAYIDREIEFGDFLEFCDITDRMFISDIRILEEAYINGGVSADKEITYQHERIISLGLITNESRLTGAVFSLDLDEDPSEQFIIEMTMLGEKYCEIIFGEKVIADAE